MTEPQQPVQAEPPSHRSVFIVEDHPLVGEGLAKLIEQQKDLRVCGQAASVGPAYDAIVRGRPDLVVVDLALRGESGLELIKRLRSLKEAPRMLVLSMYDEATYAERSLRAGALGYVMKKESASKLIEAIRRVLDGQLFISEAIANEVVRKSIGAPMAKAPPRVDQLSDRELEIFRRIGLGQKTRSIAADLMISLKTVQAHCMHIKAKLGIANATMLIREAVRWAEHEQLQ